MRMTPAKCACFQFQKLIEAAQGNGTATLTLESGETIAPQNVCASLKMKRNSLPTCANEANRCQKKPFDLSQVHRLRLPASSRLVRRSLANVDQNARQRPMCFSDHSGLPEGQYCHEYPSTTGFATCQILMQGQRRATPQPPPWYAAAE